MNKIITFLILVTLFTTNLLTAQSDKCGFDKILESKKDNPAFQQNRAAFEQYVKQFAKNSQQRSSGGTITIPCIVHIIHTGQPLGTATATGANPNNAQINSAIADMTNAYKHQGIYNTSAKNGFYDAVTDVQFVLAKRAPDGSLSTGIIRHNVMGESWGTNFANNGMDVDAGIGVPQETVTAGRYWTPSDYMNIWIVHEIENDVTTLGFASFPQTAAGGSDGLTMLANAFGYDPENDDGFLLDPTTNLNGTANHEVGHYLSLYHSFQGDNEGSSCPTDMTCGEDSDCCADIPPHKQSSGCPADANNNTCSGNGPNSYIHNFMDYADDACFHGFSENQKTRMEAALSGPRKMFCTSLGAAAPAGTYPTASTTQSVTNADEGTMGIYDVVLNGTTFTSLSSNHDGGYLNRIATQPTVLLNHASTYTITVQVGVGNTVDNELAAVYIDYNQDGDFTDAGEQLGVSAPGTGKKNGDAHSFTFTTPAAGSAPTDIRLRMRIITDYDDAALTSTTSASQGGQIEDYSITLASTTLPVDLISFNAKSLDNEKVSLNWSTASEINNSHFDIERSEDGQKFSIINQISGKGNSSRIQNYGTIDNNPTKGFNYYRLKQVDLDGGIEYSKVEVVEIKSILTTIEIYPNPANDMLFIHGLEDIDFQVNIYNQVGSLIKTIDAKKNELDISQIPVGIYYFQFTASQVNNVKRVIINR